MAMEKMTSVETLKWSNFMKEVPAHGYRFSYCFCDFASFNISCAERFLNKHDVSPSEQQLSREAPDIRRNRYLINLMKRGSRSLLESVSGVFALLHQGNQPLKKIL